MEYLDLILELILIPQVDNVIVIDKTKEKSKKNRFEGTLCITSHHFILSSRQDKQEIWLLYRNIDVMEKKVNTQSTGGSIILKCKDFRILQIDIGSADEFYKVALSIEKLSSLDQTLQYPFFYRNQSLNNSKTVMEDHWSAFLNDSMWCQLATNFSDELRITNVNQDFKICDSYSTKVIVPSSIEDEIIVSSANFREGGRFPVLCYRHNEGGVLIRSSQPMCGTIGKRCKGDEMLLNAYLRPGKRGVIVDLRSLAQMQDAKIKGGGTETDVAYALWYKSHKSVPRPFELAENLSKLIDACNDSNCSTSQWLSKLENSKWLSSVQDAMNAACVAAQCLEQDQTAVLIHGDGGRDITLVVTSLVQVILNYDCRTLKGFQALIEREWVDAGHPFNTRTRHGAYYTHGQSTSAHAPTFLLLLDCIYQIHSQFQLSFEFKTELLIEIFKHVCSSNFGTFLGDSQLERTRLKIPEKTFSLWSFINQPDNLEKFTNPVYEKNSDIIWPSVAPVSIDLWREFYLSHTQCAVWDELLDCAVAIKSKYFSVKDVATDLQNKIAKVFEEIKFENNSLSQCDSESRTGFPNLSQLNLQDHKT